MRDIIKLKLYTRRKTSLQRRNLAIATWEGVPSVIFHTLLGGQFLTGYLLYLGATSGQLGFVLAITTFVNIAQIAVAFLIQRLTSRKWALVLFISLHRILWAFTGLVPFLFPQQYWVSAFIAFYVAAFLFNTVGAMLWNSLISDIVPARVRGRYFGIRNTFLNALGTLTMFIGGMLLDRFPESQGFLYLYIIVWVCALANIITFMFYPDVTFERSVESKFLPMLRKPLQDSSFIKATLFLASFLFLQNLVVPLYSYVMLELLKINYQTISLLSVSQTLTMMGSFYIWGNLNARYSNRRLLFWTLPIIAASILSWGLLSAFPQLPVLFSAHMLFGIGVGGFNQLAFNFMIGDTPKSERPMYMAMYSAITGVAAFFGPLLGGKVYEWIADWAKWAQVFGMQLVVGSAMIVLALVLGRRILRDV
ncbi:MFS transporter [Paenibacillus lentus]|uniref:MFS transporter n=1 Tax=Paenibacillus lentus TaxID=1338368 RepID=A0A3Q8SD23_9BACL|nr:MFS transporter [Paenibacillus lentus]AZK47866.1 MFS transporter [Paenibacillus lentus]